MFLFNEPLITLEPCFQTGATLHLQEKKTCDQKNKTKHKIPVTQNEMYHKEFYCDEKQKDTQKT